MAKELPYFKFFVSEWNDGDITLESFEVQGLFINICSYYWSNEGYIFLSKTKKKFKTLDENYNILIENKILKVENDLITISFLDEQLADRDSKALINKENGKKGGRPKNQTETEKKPTGLFSETETKANTKAIREEKKREEEKRKEKKKEDVNFIYSLYPSKCPNREASNGKSEKNKEAISKHLETKSKEDLEKIINTYVQDCIKSKTYMKNFSTFLNNLPDYSEQEQKSKESENLIKYKWNIDPSGMVRTIEKEKSEKYFKSQSEGGLIPIYLK